MSVAVHDLHVSVGGINAGGHLGDDKRGVAFVRSLDDDPELAS